MTFKFSNTSLERRSGVDIRLIAISDLAIKTTLIDFGIPHLGGIRSASQQNDLYKQHKSKADGYISKSMHQSGGALDFYAFVNNKASWEPYHLAMVAAALLQSAAILSYSVNWGGLWEPSKPEIYRGVAHGWDMGHIELLD